METELKAIPLAHPRVNIPIHRFLTNEIVTELDIKKSLKIRDTKKAQIIAKTVCNNSNLEDLIKSKEKKDLKF